MTKAPSDQSSIDQLALVIARTKRNFLKVASGQGGVVGFNFLALLLNTNGLGVVTFGILVIIQSTAELFAKILGFTTWRALHKYGAADVAAGRYDLLKKRHFFGFMLDLGGAIIATLVALIAVALFGWVFGLDAETSKLGMLFSLTNLFQGTTSSEGALRLTDRFGVAVAIQIAGAFALFLNALALFSFDAELPAYIYSIGLIVIGWNVAMNIAGFLTINSLARSMDKDYPATGVDFDRRAFAGYSLATSANGTLKAARQRGEVLIVAALIGPEGASIYAVAFRIGALLARLVDAAYQAIYPEIALLLAKNQIDEARHFVFKICGLGLLVSVPAFLLAVLFGEDMLKIMFGEEFGKGYGSLLWLLYAYMVPSALFALNPYYEIGFGAGKFLKLVTIATFAFFAGAFAGPYYLGLQGAGAGSAAFTTALYILVVWQVLSRRPAAADPASSGN